MKTQDLNISSLSKAGPLPGTVFNSQIYLSGRANSFYDKPMPGFLLTSRGTLNIHQGSQVQSAGSWKDETIRCAEQELEIAIRQSLAESITLSARTSSVRDEFTARAERWEKASAVHSSPGATYLYRDYVEIMGLGMTSPQTIVPLILERLPNSGADWFFALETIAGENPAKNAETFEDAYGAWCAWAADKGYLRQYDAVLGA
jgi:hypothetical protein